MIASKSFLTGILCLLVLNVLAQEGQYIDLPGQEVKLYYEDVGTGKPLVFIPGWTMTTRFFEKQKAHFSKSHRYLAMDPRSQGKSEKTLDKNNYQEHAMDLHEFLNQLDLNEVVLIGWSSGCITLFEYAQRFGSERVDRFVFIDETPKWVGDRDKEWVYGSFEGYRGSLHGLLHTREEDAAGVVNWMLNEKVDSLERAWMVAEMMKTPDHAALSLYVDGLISDHTETIKTLESPGPSVFFLRESWFDRAKTWLDMEAPALKKERITSHAMFWTEAAQFNQLLERYISPF